MDINLPLENFKDWLPVRIYQRENELFADWCYMGDERFVQPFFDETIERRLRQPFNLLFRHQTSIKFLGELYEQNPGLPPNGFIFHMSRCGSTLVARMLAALTQNIVLSEPPPVDSVLRSNTKNSAISDEQRIDWLKWIASALGQKRNDEEEHYFIKFDSWNTLDLNLIELAFPDVPWIFLYRNPVEVIVSQMRQRGAQMVPGSLGQILPGLDLAQILQMPPEEYCARILARICENALSAAKSKNALMINYNQLPEVFAPKILKHFRVDYAPKDIEQMKVAAHYNAKMPQMEFEPDSEAKKRDASRAATEAAEKWVNPLYERLEKIRCENNV
jgi:gluconate kinase